MLLPSDRGLNKKYADQKYQSQIFSSEGGEPVKAGKKHVGGDNAEAGELLKYNYALPYRPEVISVKPELSK